MKLGAPSRFNDEWCQRQAEKFSHVDDTPQERGGIVFERTLALACPVCGAVFFTYQPRDTPYPPYTDPGASLGPLQTCGDPRCHLESEKRWLRKDDLFGYGKCEKITPERTAALSARLRQDPEYFTTFSRAVDYLSRDEWWLGKAKQFTIDLLIDQAGRAQELSEKTPSTPTVESYNSRTADIDEMFIKQMQALGYN